MRSTRALIATALLVILTGGNPLRGDDKPAEIDRLKKELADAKKRIAALEESNLKLTGAAEKAKVEVARARNAEKLALTIAGENAKKIEALMAKLLEEKFQERKYPPLPRVDPSELPADLCGKVTDGADDLLIIDIGIDAGLAMGNVLGVYRVNGADSRYLGTVRIMDKFNLYPKAAVVKFTPVRKVPLKDLKPEELPKKGDLVRPMKPKD